MGSDEAAVGAATAGTGDDNETSTVGDDWTSAGPEAVFTALGGDDAAAGAGVVCWWFRGGETEHCGSCSQSSRFWRGQLKRRWRR